MKKNLKKGFTLTELIIVIVIIGILAAVLIPSLSNYVKSAKKSSAEQNALSIYKEKLSMLDIQAEDYLEQLDGNYLVKVDGYYVFIEKGALVTAKTKSINDVSVQLKDNQEAGYEKYFYILDSGAISVKYVKIA